MSDDPLEDLVVAVDPQEVNPRRLAPQFIHTVDDERFQVQGEPTLYEDPTMAIRRARKRGSGSVVVRLSDGKVIARISGFIPMPPSD